MLTIYDVCDMIREHSHTVELTIDDDYLARGVFGVTDIPLEITFLGDGQTRCFTIEAAFLELEPSSLELTIRVDSSPAYASFMIGEFLRVCAKIDVQQS